MKICPTCARRFPDNVLRCPEDGTELAPFDEALAPDPDNLVGRRMFGDYVVERKLGEGGMGAVYLAKHSTIDQSVAIKVLHGHAAEQSELVQRFNREAKAIARLTHPNIIRVFIFGHTPEGLIYLAMEYVEGESLRDLVDAKDRISERHAIYIIKQALGAVAEAHDLGIICSVWLNPGVATCDDLDHRALFDIHRKAMTQAIEKAMHHEPSID